MDQVRIKDVGKPLALGAVVVRCHFAISLTD